MGSLTDDGLGLNGRGDERRKGSEDGGRVAGSVMSVGETKVGLVDLILFSPVSSSTDGVTVEPAMRRRQQKEDIG